MNKKRISFDKYDATHIYEYLMFYWENFYLRDERKRERQRNNRFGNCPQCTFIGQRLEKFIGKDNIDFIYRLKLKYRKKIRKNK